MLHTLKQRDSNKVNTKYVGVGGRIFTTDTDQALAKSVESAKGTHYFCKFNTCGVEAGHLVNPWSMYSDAHINFVNKTNAHTGKLLQEYQEVQPEVFELYVRYLSSQSDVHYRQAERIAING
jgi:hypothetical protein